MFFSPVLILHDPMAADHAAEIWVQPFQTHARAPDLTRVRTRPDRRRGPDRDRNDYRPPRPLPELSLGMLTVHMEVLSQPESQVTHCSPSPMLTYIPTLT